MSNAGMLWTRDEEDQLKKEINEGRCFSDIVYAHGRTPYAIIGRLQMLGLLVSVGRNYHLVNPDPWALGTEISALQKAAREASCP